VAFGITHRRVELLVFDRVTSRCKGRWKTNTCHEAAVQKPHILALGGSAAHVVGDTDVSTFSRSEFFDVSHYLVTW
jgi:hypothetical protein